MDLGDEVLDLLGWPSKETQVISWVDIISLVDSFCENDVNGDTRVVWVKQLLLESFIPHLPMMLANLGNFDRIPVSLGNKTINSLAEIHCRMSEDHQATRSTNFIAHHVEKAADESKLTMRGGDGCFFFSHTALRIYPLRAVHAYR